MPDKSWKRWEREVAGWFGGFRNPLSGNSEVSHGMRRLIHIDATAGWGKTTAIERDIKKYAEFVQPWHRDKALYIVFTNRNAQSALRRLSDYVSAGNVRTLHSLCYSFLPSRKPVMDGDLLSEFARKNSFGALSGGGMFFVPKTRGDRLLSAYYYARNRGMTPEEVVNEKRQEFAMFRERAEEIYRFWVRWERFKKEKGAYDYADILELSNPKFFGVYLAVDEAQDFTPLMWKALERLIQNSPNLRRVVIVGDCDQAVYEFQGADPVYFLTFPEILSQRYGFVYEKMNAKNISRRVPSKPLEFALAFLKPVVFRDHEKEILPAREGGEVLFMGREEFLSFLPSLYLAGKVIVIQERHRHELEWWKKRLKIPYCVGFDERYRKFRAYRNLLEEKAPHRNLYTVFKDSVLKHVHYIAYLERWGEYYEKYKKERERWIASVSDENLRSFLMHPERGYAVLTTMHSQKGEEGDVVWVSGKWTKKIRPSDSERKLYFTACTRTKDVLVIDRDFWHNIKSLRSS
ncbi:MAG TPA: hypothetical protein EYH49_03775 [Aquifex aeolicus]|nr:hypothetical protein [Aquifex aeolicus]